MVPVGDGMVYLGVAGPGPANYLVGPSDTVDARNVLVGRDTMNLISTLTIGGDGLDPWQASDSLFALGMNSDSGYGAASALTVGATSFGPTTSATSEQILGSQGDEVWVIQRRSTNVHNELSLFSQVASLHRSAGGTQPAMPRGPAWIQMGTDQPSRTEPRVTAADTATRRCRTRGSSMAWASSSGSDDRMALPRSLRTAPLRIDGA